MHLLNVISADLNYYCNSIIIYIPRERDTNVFYEIILSYRLNIDLPIKKLALDADCP